MDLEVERVQFRSRVVDWWSAGRDSSVSGARSAASPLGMPSVWLEGRILLARPALGVRPVTASTATAVARVP